MNTLTKDAPKAIPTRYKKYKFRSRTEARWAVFLDALQCEWIYEPEGFELESGLYLPDFWVTNLNIKGTSSRPVADGFFIEIKPAGFDQHTLILCRQLADATRKPTFLLAGNVGVGEYKSWRWEPYGAVESCPTEDLVSVFAFHIVTACSPLFQLPGNTFGGILNKGFTAAGSARFEHGETPE